MDLYQVLGVPRNAAPADVERAYLRLARRYHPGINPGDGVAAELYRRVQDAYAVLGDPERRREYDRGGAPPPAGLPDRKGSRSSVSMLTLATIERGTLNVTTWPNYFSQENYDNFTKKTGVPINVNVFGSNEEMLAKLQAGSTGWDVLVPTNYTISTYKGLDLIQPLDLARLPNYDAASNEARTSRSSAGSLVFQTSWPAETRRQSMSPAPKRSVTSPSRPGVT